MATPRFSTHAIDEPRPMRVVVIGAGFSGLIAAIRFIQYVKNVDLQLYEAQDGIGGTWYANRYPGLACDIPSHCVAFFLYSRKLGCLLNSSKYQLTFHEKTDWSAFYAPGREIRAYLESVVEKYNLHPFIKLSHRLTSAIYNEATGKWDLTITPKGSEAPAFVDHADVLFTGFGGLSRWKWPDIPGLDTFKGKVIHSANWETGEGAADAPWEETVGSWGDKRVGVVGVGSSAIQIVAALQPKVGRLVNYVRSRTWISGTFLAEYAQKLGMDKGSGNYQFTKEDKEKYTDPAFYKEFRREMESGLSAIHVVTLKDHPAAEIGRKMFTEDMTERLNARPDILESIVPNFLPGCRRLTPGPGYLEALCESNVSFNSSPIKQVLPNGIETADGKFEELDMIVCATGYDTSFQLPFPIIGRNGVKLSDKYTPHPRLYLSVAVDGFPNWFQALGPNAAVGSGSLLILIERQVQYAVEATLKLQREHLKSMDVKKEAVDDWDEYLEHHFAKTVFGTSCRSWYKSGKEEGRVLALWPGSCLHAIRALEHPRWEDYNYEQLDGNENRFFWAGNGTTVAEEDPKGDRAWYLSEVDYPPVPLHSRSNTK